MRARMVVLPCTAHAAILHGTHCCIAPTASNTCCTPMLHLARRLLHSLNLLHALQPVATIHYNGRCNHNRAWAFTAERAAAPEVAAGAPQNGRRGVSPAQPACKCATGGEPKSGPVADRGRGVLEYGVLERVPLPAVPYSGTLLAHGVAAAAVLTGTHGYSRVLYWPTRRPIESSIHARRSCAGRALLRAAQRSVSTA
jgi:hypothetical protein